MLDKMLELVYNPENIVPVMMAFLLVAGIGLFVLIGFLKMRTLRRSGKLLYSWDPKVANQLIKLDVPHSGGNLLIFMDYSYSGVARNSPPRFIELHKTGSSEGHAVELSYTDGHMDQVSMNSVYTRPTNGTVLGEIKDIEAGNYSVELKKGFEDQSDIKRIDFVLIS